MNTETTPSAGAVRAAAHIFEIFVKDQHTPKSWEDAIAKAIDKETGADLKELQARLLQRTEESTATAYRDAEIIRQLRFALTNVMVLRPHHGFCGDPVTQESCKCHPANKSARVVLGEWKEGQP